MDRQIKKLGEVLEYEQPTKYLVSSTDYKDEYLTPVLTAGKSFLLGNTNEKNGIFPKEKLPVIIFDDFTTAIKFVDFPFKVKSSAMKILHAKKNEADIKYLFNKLLTIKFPHDQHKRYWISECSNVEISLPPLKIQKQIVERLDKIAEAQKLNDGLIQKTDELFQSLLHKELNPSGRNWKIKELQEIVEARSGFGFSMEIQGKTDGEIPFYKVSDMNLAGNQIEMVYHNNTITTKQCADRRYKPAPKGTIIFPKIGAAVATNKKRILTRDSLYDNNVMGLIPTAEILSEYLFFWMLRFDISLWASQSMPPSIKKSTVDKFTISLPKLEIQKQIVAKLSAVQDYKKQLLEQKTKLKELFDSSLSKSMAGEKKSKDA